MCGIFGLLRYDSRPIDVSLFDKMRASMWHRGPDDYGHFISGGMGIANLRLSIIDLKTGRQPIFNEDGKIAIVYNGEVYNFKDLRSKLDKHQFRTQTDTESLLHAYEEWGLGCLPLFNGMFAFAIWDGRSRSLILARDRMGIKPLYYTFQPDYFAFASEIKSLVCTNLVKPRVNRDQVATYLSLKYAPFNETLFDGIHRLLPGEWLAVNSEGKKRSGRYWEFGLDSGLNEREEDYFADLRELVKNAVQDQLVADVSVGAFLSGGIDSSIVVTEMARLKGAGVKAFTIDYDGEDDTHTGRYGR